MSTRALFSRLVAGALLFLSLAGLAFALDFPPLTGRIVDNAGIIPPAVSASIETKLQALEEKSGIQLVVATVPSLQGQEIEDYANLLFRHWGLGEKAKNNGVLLLVAPKEKRVRIEVGYGLEGTLTDALSSLVIANAMAPRFKTGDFGGGINRGVDDIIAVLSTDAQEWQKRPDLRAARGETPADEAIPWVAILFFIFILFLLTRSPRGSNLASFLLGVLLGSGRNGGGFGGGGYGGGGFGDGGGFGGGFSGGGGSSGGGGASGSW
ncbi:TPM domain-containing protein [Beijerinckia mobilis]|uniref:TPM domain-containing protein n=1 Tax=Beijerinckia mobilis TaxID=231434 RepID=UPI0005568D30|nr:TPM domain-containing protein [Beijerinckia mobilis]